MGFNALFERNILIRRYLVKKLLKLIGYIILRFLIMIFGMIPFSLILKAELSVDKIIGVTLFISIETCIFFPVLKGLHECNVIVIIHVDESFSAVC